MSHFNKYKDVEIMLPDLNFGVSGEYRFEAFKGFEFPRGSGIVWEYPFTRRVALDWFGNLVTNNGLENYGVNLDGLLYCHVGTDNTPAVNIDIQLGAFVAGIGRSSQTAAAQATPPYFGHYTAKYRFSPNFGGGNVNLNEVGVGNTIAAGNLSSRALTEDSGGNPVTVPVLVDEYLDVFYKRRNYPAHIVEATGVPNDLTGSIDISGTSHNFTVRPALVTVGGGSAGSGSAWGWGSGLVWELLPTQGFAFENTRSALAHDESAALGAVTSTLSGATSPATNAAAVGSYTASSYGRELFYQWGIDNANFGVGIGGLTLKTRLGAYQVLFSPVVPKVQGEVFTWYHNFSWARKNTWV